MNSLLLELVLEIVYQVNTRLGGVYDDHHAVDLLEG